MGTILSALLCLGAAWGEERVLTLRETSFVAGGSELRERRKDPLYDLAAELRADPRLRVRLEAFPEGRRDRELAFHRALTVRDFLVRNGVASKRVAVLSFRRKGGRRVEVVLY